MMKKKAKVEEATTEQNISSDKNISDTQNEFDNQTAEQSNSDDKEEKLSEPEVNSLEELQKVADEMKDKYLRLSAEFDNYRKRTLREKMDLSKFAAEDVLISLLPVVDDFDRAMKSLEAATDIDAVKLGITLIYNKFDEFLKAKGVSEIDAKGKDFDTDLHEAITKIPVQDESQKGKIVDVVQKGYTLNEKVMRFSKVVIGE